MARPNSVPVHGQAVSGLLGPGLCIVGLDFSDRAAPDIVAEICGLSSGGGGPLFGRFVVAPASFEMRFAEPGFLVPMVLGRRWGYGMPGIVFLVDASRHYAGDPTPGDLGELAQVSAGATSHGVCAALVVDAAARGIPGSLDAAADGSVLLRRKGDGSYMLEATTCDGEPRYFFVARSADGRWRAADA